MILRLLDWAIDTLLPNSYFLCSLTRAVGRLCSPSCIYRDQGKRKKSGGRGQFLSSVSTDSSDRFNLPRTVLSEAAVCTTRDGEYRESPRSSGR